jgi:acetyltransferase-like isoleucine patch superfamily enzyme
MLLVGESGCITIGRDSLVNAGSILRCDGGSISIGSNASIQYYCVVYGAGGCTIGDDCRVSSHVKFLAVNHVFTDPDTPIRAQGVTARGIVLENDVWIGAGAVVLDGVRIGQGSVLGAGSVITKCLPPYSVAVGNPARVIRSRRADANK